MDYDSGELTGVPAGPVEEDNPPEDEAASDEESLCLQLEGDDNEIETDATDSEAMPMLPDKLGKNIEKVLLPESQIEEVSRRVLRPRKTVNDQKRRSCFHQKPLNPSTGRKSTPRQKLSNRKGPPPSHAEKAEAQYVFSKMAFARLVREVTQKLNPDKSFKFQATAFQALQMGCEAFLAIIFDNMSLVASHSGRSTILQKDIYILEKIAGKFRAISDAE